MIIISPLDSTFPLNYAIVFQNQHSPNFFKDYNELVENLRYDKEADIIKFTCFDESFGYVSYI